MGSLSTAIVEREIATMRQVEEALARQVLYGGDLATNLLEVLGGSSEGALTYVLAEHYALMPAPTGELPLPDDDVVRLVPADTATRHSFSPLAIEHGSLVVAVAEPLPREVEDELTFTLGMPLLQLAAPLVRIRQALARVYKQALDRRLLRLLARLSGFPDPMPSSMPPPLSGGPSGGFRAPRFPRAFGDEPTTRPGMGDKNEPVAPPLPIDPEAANEARAAIGTGRVATPTRRLIKWMARSARTHAASRGRRHRGPLTIAAAEEALSECTLPEDALLTFFDFAKQFMTYAALFVVHGDLAEGRDAFGPGTGRNEVAGIGVPLDLPSIFAHAKNRNAPVCAPLERDGIDSQLAKDLGRSPKGNVVAIPVVVRRRTVAIVYGDDGDHGLELDEIGEVIGVASLVAAVLEKLAVLKKRERATPSPPEVAGPIRKDTLLGMAVPTSPPVVAAQKEKKQEAFVRALGLPAAEHRVGAVMPAPTPVTPRAEEPTPAAGTRRTTASFSKHQTPPPEAPPPPPELEVGSADENDDLLQLAMDEIGGAPPSSEPPPPEAELDEHGNPLSRSSYHPPRQPPSPRKMQSLPSVIVDVGAEQTEIVDRLLADSGNNDDDLLGEVLREGVIVVPPILAALPGPLFVPRESLLNGSARPSAAGPLFRALVALRRTALPFVVVHSANVDREPRLFATLLLGELPYPESATAVVARMFDPDETVKRAASVAARLLKASPDVWALVVSNLERILRSSSEHDARRVTAAGALGELSTVNAVPALIAVLQKEPRPVREAAVKALRRITCQDFGTDVEFWDAWWSERGAEDRAEWLFDALTQDSPDLREQAARELAPVVPMDMSGFVGMNEAERHDLQARCRTWWRGGRVEPERAEDPRGA